MTTFELQLTCDLLEEDDADCAFQVEYAPGTPDVMYLSNGDPGYPGDPAECSVLKAWRVDTAAPLTEDSFRDWSRVEDALYDAANTAYVQHERDYDEV